MNDNRWDELSLTDKAEVMKQAVANGITNLQDIRDSYNDTVNNYIDNIYANGTEESYGDPSDHYNNVDEEMISHMSPDARGHYDDSVKLPNHPSSPTRGTFNGQYFDFTDKGFEDPNYTMFGLQDNGDGNTIMRYNGDVVMPELTVTPNGNYYDDTYNNIKIQQGHKHELGGPVKHDARYNHATQIYQSYINQGVNPQTALELTNQKIAEKGWTGWVSGDNKRYNNVNSFTDHTIDQFNRLYPDSLKSNNFNQFFQGIEGGRTKYNPTPNTYRQHLLQTRPGVKKRINEYRRLQGQSPLSLVSPTSTPLPWEEGILYNPQLPVEVPTEQPVIAADGGYLYARGGKLSVQNQRAGYAVSYFMNKGLSKVAAAGLVGNLMRESRMDPNALNPDKYGGAHGLAQFRGARWKNLQKMYGNNPTFEQQLDYIWHELNTTHKKGLQMLKSSRTVDEAAKNAFGYYEFSKGPEDAIAQMAKYNKKMGYNQANGYKAMNDGINNAWVAYGKANPNIKLTGLNLSTPNMGFNGTMPQHDFAGVVDSINLDSPLYSTNSVLSQPLPPYPTNYGKPVDYSTIKHPEKEVPATLDWSKGEEDDNSSVGIFSLMNTISSIGKPKSPLATYTPQKQNNAPFTVGISQSNSNFLDIPLMAAYGGKLYGEGGKKDNKDNDIVYVEPVKPIGKMKVVSVADPSKGEIAVHSDDIPVTTAPLGGNTDDVDWDYINQFTNDTPTEEDINDAMDKKISDYLTASNNATAVGNPSNVHLNDRGIYGAMANAAWEKEHPNLAAWSYVTAAAPFAVTAYPFMAGASDALASTALGEGITSGLSTISNVAKGNTLLPWLDAGATSLSISDGVRRMRNGDFSPEAVLEAAPLTRVVPRTIGIANNLRPQSIRNYTYVSKAPIGYGGKKDALIRFIDGISSGKPADIDNPWWFTRQQAKGLDEYAVYPKTLSDAERESYLADFEDNALKARADMWRIYNHIPQKYGTFTPSKLHKGAYTAEKSIKDLKYIPSQIEGQPQSDFVTTVGGNIGIPEVKHLGWGRTPKDNIRQWGITITNDWFDLHPFSRPDDRIIKKYVQPLFEKAVATPIKKVTGKTIKTPEFNFLKPLEDKVANFEVGKLIGSDPVLVQYDIPWTQEAKFIEDANGNPTFLKTYTPGFQSEDILPEPVKNWEMYYKMFNNPTIKGYKDTFLK